MVAVSTAFVVNTLWPCGSQFLHFRFISISIPKFAIEIFNKMFRCNFTYHKDL